MSRGHTASRRRSRSTGRKTTVPWFSVPWKCFLIALVPVVLAVCYMGWVAPSLVPVSTGVKVPFPAATRFLESVCAWCGKHRLVVLSIGLGLLVPGTFSRLFTGRYYVVVAVFVSVALSFAYLSISAPIDRLLHAVEQSIPKDERIPDYHSSNTR